VVRELGFQTVELIEAEGVDLALDHRFQAQLVNPQRGAEGRNEVSESIQSGNDDHAPDDEDEDRCRVEQPQNAEPRQAANADDRLNMLGDRPRAAELLAQVQRDGRHGLAFVRDDS
jgi:hypothetical protein